MKALISVLLAYGLASTAFADEPTVTLTQPELQTYVNAEATKAVANYAAAQEAAKAQNAYKKIQSAFAPKPQEGTANGR